MPVVPPLETGHYYLYQELAEYLRTAEEAAPHLLRLFSVGNSYEGRPIYLAEITNRAKGEGLEKPAIWIDGNLHGCDLLASSACLELIRQLVSDYGRDPVITDLLDHVTFYVVPRVSPDGAEHCLTTGEVLHSGSRPYPRQPAMMNLRPGDINGDGRVLQMRVPDEAGEWKPSRRDPRLLVRRQPDDRNGPFYRVFPEGFLEGSVEAPIRALACRSQLDFDRNFPCGWRPECELPGAGPYPLSEPETRAVADFFRTRGNIGIVVSCSSWGSGIAHPQLIGSDQKLFAELGRRLEEISGYPVGAAPDPAGSFLQWVYEHRGLVAFRPQLWSMARAVGVEVDPVAFASDRTEPESLSVLRWLDVKAPGFGFVPWTPVEHPQLGIVEVGGWDPLYSWLNPPPGQTIQDVSDKFVRIVLALACGLPRLKVRKVGEELMGWTEFVPADAHQGEFLPLRRLTVEVENTGFLPSWLTERARQMESVAPLEVRLHQEASAALTFGESFTTFEPLRGCSDLFPKDASWRRLEWVVRGPGLVQAEFLHEKTGSAVARWTYDPNAGYGAVHTGQSTPAVPVSAPPPPAPQHRPAPPAPPQPVARRNALEVPPAAARSSLQAPPATPPQPGYGAMAPPPAHPAPLGAGAQHPRPAHPGPGPGHAAYPAHPAHPGHGHPPPAAARPQHPHPQHPPRPGVAPRPGEGETPRHPVEPGFGNRPIRHPSSQEIPPGFGNIPTSLPSRSGPGASSSPPQAPRVPAPTPGPPLGAPVEPEAPGSPREPAPGRGRVLGIPPVKPGAVPPPGFAARAQELVQAGQARREGSEGPRREDVGFSPGLPMKDPAPRRAEDSGFSPGLPVKEPAFSPGLPLKPAYSPPTTGVSPGPAEPAPAVDFDTPPPEAPPSESRIPAPLLLRRLRKD